MSVAEVAWDGPVLLRSALSAAALGWHVFPCVPDGKRPALRGNWPDRLARLARKHGERYPAGTFIVDTPPGGCHLYFAAGTTPAGRGRPAAAGPGDHRADQRGDAGRAVRKGGGRHRAAGDGGRCPQAPHLVTGKAFPLAQLH